MKYYACNESLFTHTLDAEQLWVLSIIDKVTKEFKLVVSKNREAETLNIFVTIFIPKGNYIVCDGWRAYNWIVGLMNHVQDIQDLCMYMDIMISVLD